MSVSVSVCVAMYIDLSNPWLSCTKWHWFDSFAQPNYIYICECAWHSIVCTKTWHGFLKLLNACALCHVKCGWHSSMISQLKTRLLRWCIFPLSNMSIIVYWYEKTKPSISHDKAHDIHVMCGMPHWLSPCNSLILLLMCMFAYM